MQNQYQQPQESLKECENCHKKFSSDKIDLHEAYCFRNFKKCHECEQLYDIHDQQSHIRQYHTKKQCRHCHLSFGQKAYDDHLANCPRRPVRCQFCQNDIAYEQVLRHQQACGARTNICQICHKYIPLREIVTHKLRCQAESQEQLRRNIHENPFPLNRIRSQQYRHDHQRNKNYEVNNNLNNLDRQHREHRRSQQTQQNHYNRRHHHSRERNSSKGQRDVKVKFNYQQIKPSHVIGPQKIREPVDIVPISVRLALEKRAQKNNQKMPLQNKN